MWRALQFSCSHTHVRVCVCVLACMCVCLCILNTTKLVIIRSCILCGGDLNGTLTLSDDEGVCSSPHMHMAHCMRSDNIALPGYK